MREIVKRPFTDDKFYYEIALNSTEASSLPTADVITGSLALEVDTKKIYAYDETAAEWTEQLAL